MLIGKLYRITDTLLDRGLHDYGCLGGHGRSGGLDRSFGGGRTNNSHGTFQARGGLEKLLLEMRGFGTRHIDPASLRIGDRRYRRGLPLPSGMRG
jgi:hypothetical protein